MPQPTNPISDAHDSARMRFDKVRKAHSTVIGLRSALDRLMKLGDMVQPEDVIHEAGILMGKSNLSSMEMAKFLSTMPQEGGQPLMGWLAQHEQGLVQMEQAARGALGTARHQMGIAALHELALHSLNHSQVQAANTRPIAGGSTLAITNPQAVGTQ